MSGRSLWDFWEILGLFPPITLNADCTYGNTLSPELYLTLAYVRCFIY